MPDVFKILKDLEAKAVGIDPNGDKMQEGFFVAFRSVGLPIHKDDYDNPWDPFGGNLSKALEKAAAQAPPADPATAPKTASAGLDPKQIAVASVGRSMKTYLNTFLLLDDKLQMRNDYAVMPSSSKVSDSWWAVITGANGVPTESTLSPELQTAYDAAQAVLTDKDGNPTPKYQAYMDREDEYKDKVKAYNRAYAAAMTDPIRLENFPRDGVLYQQDVDEALDRWNGLLSPALPAVPADADPATKAAATDAFNAIKAEAVRLWNRLTLQSLSGLMLDFKPSLASPEDWYDTSSSQAWTSQTFHIDASAASPPTPVWRLRPRNEFLAQELKLPPATEFRREQVLEAVVQPAPALDAATPEAEIRPTVAGLADRARMTARLTDDGTGNMHDLLLTDLSRVDLKSRIAASRYLGELAPQAPASTSSVSITFEYCLVDIRRPWWLDAFVDQGSWYLPTVSAGRLTAEDNPAALSWLPAAFVAVRNLRIDASWSGDDAANVALATGFGPFKVESAAGGQSLVHPGLQVIGWLLQHLPPLPPVSDPGPAPAPAVPRTYGTFIVKDGKITEAAYRWCPLGPLTQLRFFATGTVEIQLSDERVSLRRSPIHPIQ